jgi:hypothetical protein
VAAAASWRAPVRVHVVRAFHYSPRAPFARGARRGVELAARRGERVVAPCSGPVSFRGFVPPYGPALTIRCGPLVATLLGVRASHGGRARRGAQLGHATGPVRLGARRAGERWGYVDPLGLIGADVPRAAPPAVVHIRPRATAPPARPAVRSAPGVPGLPWPAWAGIGCALGSLLGPWAISTSRRRSTTSTRRRTLATRTR